MKIYKMPYVQCRIMKGMYKSFSKYSEFVLEHLRVFRIDEDFLAFLDGVDVENVMKEAVTALTDGEDFTAYLREKSENALDHILVGFHLLLFLKFLFRCCLSFSLV